LVPINLVSKNPDMSALFPVLTPLQPLTEMFAVAGMTEALRQALGLDPAVDAASYPSAHQWPGGLAVTFTGTSSAIPSKYRNGKFISHITIDPRCFPAATHISRYYNMQFLAFLWSLRRMLCKRHLQHFYWMEEKVHLDNCLDGFPAKARGWLPS
jgi:hypothetical protein